MARFSNNKRKPKNNNNNNWDNKKQKGDNGENRSAKGSMKNWKLVIKESPKFENFYKVHVIK
jgi:hypothetical protein